MSITLANKTTFNHETARTTAMNHYPYGHPARRAMWEEYNVPVPGSDDFHISEWAWFPIWTALEENGLKGPIFPSIGEKRAELLKALTALLDVAVTEPEIPNLNLPNNDNTIVMFNNQTVLEALEGFIAFIQRNDEIFAL